MSRDNRDISNAWVVKTVSIFGSMSNGRSRWEDFVAPWIDTENDRPNLRADEENRLRGTSRLNLDKEGNPYYEGVLTKKTEFLEAHKPRLDPRIKFLYTRHQSVSLVNPDLKYYPPVFDNGQNNGALVGIAMPLKDVLLQRIMWYNEKGTYKRYYDAESPEQAAKNAALFVKRGVNFLRAEDLQEEGILRHSGRLNELHARLKRLSDAPQACVCIFNDNLQSRLLAQLCALDLQYRLNEPSPRKIIFYKGFREYTPEEQDASLEKARESQRHYALALYFLKNAGALGRDNRYTTKAELEKAYLLLKNISTVLAQNFLKACIKTPDAFCALASTSSLSDLLVDFLLVLDAALIEMIKNATTRTPWKEFFSHLSEAHIRKSINFLMSAEATIVEKNKIAFVALKALLKKNMERLITQLGWGGREYIPFFTVNNGIPDNKEHLKQSQAAILKGFLDEMAPIQEIDLLAKKLEWLIERLDKVVFEYDHGRFFRLFSVKNELKPELSVMIEMTKQLQEIYAVAELAASL